MKKAVSKTEAGRQYSTALAAHYKAKDLHEAIDLYKGVMAAHPDTEEAKYSRSQINNIVNTVVPKQEVFDAQLELFRVHLDNHLPWRPRVNANQFSRYTSTSRNDFCRCTVLRKSSSLNRRNLR